MDFLGTTHDEITQAEEISFADLEEKQRILEYLKAMSQSIRNNQIKNNN